MNLPAEINYTVESWRAGEKYAAFANLSSLPPRMAAYVIMEAVFCLNASERSAFRKAFKHSLEQWKDVVV